MNRHKGLSRAYTAVVLAFLYLPILVLIVFSFNKNKSRGAWTGFTLDWYRKLFTNDMILTAFMNTLIVAVVSSIFATVIGTAAAIGINSMNRWMKKSLRTLTYIPIMSPEIIMGVSLMLLFVFLRTELGLPLEMGLCTLILSHITFNIPYVIFNVLPKLRQMDKYAYDAALDLGCNPWQAFYKVVIPEIMPGITAGFLMAVTYSLDDFVISYFTAGPTSQTLPLAIWGQLRRRVSPEMNALSAIVFVVVLALLVAGNFSAIRRENRDRKAVGR
ncbi:MAG: ABC transporter permease [Provencibacterium sp.]|jgi:spermidine/putrescine transport system permease protein|nr:ABC transporter permease [Provencibacterium sp.]